MRARFGTSVLVLFGLVGGSVLSGCGKDENLNSSSRSRDGGSDSGDDAGSKDGGSDAGGDDGGGNDGGVDGGAKDSGMDGDSGVGTPPCENPPPCFVVERNSEGECVPRMLDDGTACEDGNACTDGDHCQDGACVGTAITGDARLRGEVTTFGASPGMHTWMEGVAAFLGPDRLVFLESKSYTRSQLDLVRVGSQGLERLATGSSEVGYQYAIDWVYRPTSHIVPLNQTHFAVVGSHETSTVPPKIELFEVAGDELVSQGVTEMPADSADAFGVAAREDALWVCGSRELQTYTFGSDRKTLTLAGRVGIDACSGIAVAPDGDTLFVSGRGILALDVSTNPAPEHLDNTRTPPICPAGTVTPWCSLLAGQNFEDVQVNQSYLVALVTNNVGESGGVRVMSMDDSSAVRSIDDATSPDAFPIGMALAGQRLFVEWYRFGAGSSWPTLSVALHPLDAKSTEPLADYTVREDCCGGEPWTLVSFAAQENLAVLQPWRRVVRFDESTQKLDAVTGTEQGSLKALLPNGDHEVVAVGPYASHRLDVSDPDRPRIVSGGMNQSPRSGDFQLLASHLGTPARLVNTTPGIFQRLAQKSEKERFSLFDTSLAPEAMSIGSFWIAGELDGKTQLGAGGGLLFQIRPVDDADYRIRRFQTQGGFGVAEQELLPDMSVVVEGEPVPELPRRGLAWAFGVSESGSEVVIVEERYDQAIVERATFVTWLSVATEGVTLLARARFDGLTSGVTQVVVSADQALMITSDRAVRLRRNGSSIEQGAVMDLTETADALNPLFTRILSFDGERALMTQHRWLPKVQSQWSVEVLNADDLSPLARYDTSEEVQSATVVGTRLVFGMNAAVSVADAQCGGP